MGIRNFLKIFLEDRSHSSTQEPRPVPPSEIINVEGFASIKMWKIEGGSFWMGATSEQENEACDDEKPCHKVSVNSFLVSNLILEDDYYSIIYGINYQSHSHLNAFVRWYDCQNFINRLYHLTGKKFRLPTEAEWEFIARGGNKSKGYKYISGNQLQSIQDYNHLTLQNELQLWFSADGYGEWCQDIYGTYNICQQHNPTGTSSGMNRVMRYGNGRVSQRGFGVPSQESGCFRLVHPCYSFKFGKATK